LIEAGDEASKIRLAHRSSGERSHFTCISLHCVDPIAFAVWFYKE